MFSIPLPCHCLLPHRYSSGKVDDYFFLGAAAEEGGSSTGKKMSVEFLVLLCVCQIVGNMRYLV